MELPKQSFQPVTIHKKRVARRSYRNILVHLVWTLVTISLLASLVIIFRENYTLSIRSPFQNPFVIQNKKMKIISPLGMVVQKAYGKDNPVSIDDRGERIELIFKQNDSPMRGQGKFIVQMADKYAIRWTLVASIAFKESTLGKNTAAPYNAWGYTKGGSANGFRAFSSWEEGIEEESKLLSESYRSNENSGIQAKYCPSYECDSNWVATVTGMEEKILGTEL